MSTTKKLTEDYKYWTKTTKSLTVGNSRHITGVKKPWQRSNRFEAFQQLLVTNQHLDKLAAARIDFISQGMLPSSYGPPPGAIEPAPNHDEREDDAEPTDE